MGEDRDSGADDGPDGFWEVGRAVQLDHVGAALLDQTDCGPNRRLGALLDRTEGNVTAHQGPLDASPHRLTGQDHLVHGNF